MQLTPLDLDGQGLFYWSDAMRERSPVANKLIDWLCVFVLAMEAMGILAW
jgi:hypothetical protein